ncbi:FAD-binding domain-containing protein [Synechococcus sp. C9]|uniref:FAD-binding domain-containing protein n=1 Tax=Synechococcus sp. C9 TaxID=102119 RepID=UPI001FF6AC8E|nr:FAD-binding domain-containing protein [Synechococcus sp. C9]
MPDLILFWHRRDLRIEDSVGLHTARLTTPKVVGIFCFDPQILRRDDMAPVRVYYLRECLADLQRQYEQIGSELLILWADPVVAIPRLAQALKAAVYWHQDVEPYARQRDQQVIQVLNQQGIIHRQFWDQLLHTPDEIVTKMGQPYTVFTPFWKNWSQQNKVAPYPKLENCTKLTETERQIAQNAGVIPLPTMQELGFHWSGQWDYEPGTQGAKNLLTEFGRSAIYSYQEQRNFPAVSGTSRLSAALKFGVIGIRTLWQFTQDCLQNFPGNESVVTWQQELAWREFYQHGMYHFPRLETHSHRAQFDGFPWENNEHYFQAWCAGETGYPIVDAAMRQLNQTGWMHNRCRMIVASFLTKDLLIDWRWGERYFMQHLIDGDLSANNGGWQWSASVGMDPRPLRIFNPNTQAVKFDPEAEYIYTWVPELRSVDVPQILSNQITPLERQALGYPQPIVNHQKQQQLFKQKYQMISQSIE